MIKKIGSIMLAGLFAILPLIITLVVLSYLFNVVYGWLGPSSAFGRLVARNADKRAEAVLLYVATLLVILLLIFMIGLFTRGAAGSRFDSIRNLIGGYFARQVTGVIKKVPFINTVYSSAEQVVDLFQQHEKDAVKSMSNVVLARIANTHILGMLASSKPVQIDGVWHFYVYFPNTPVPATGFNYIIPCEDVVDIDMSVEELTRVYVSFGSLGPVIHSSRKQERMNAEMPTIDRNTL
jgi:uncharacterized membrane protein